MRKFIILSVLICSVLPSFSKDKLPYQNPKLSVEERVKDLVSRMTLEEKVGQLRCTLAWNYSTIKGKNVVPSESFKKDIAEGNIGMLWASAANGMRFRMTFPPSSASHLRRRT